MQDTNKLSPLLNFFLDFCHVNTGVILTLREDFGFEVGLIVEQRLFGIDRDTVERKRGRRFGQYLARFWIAVALMNDVNGNYVNAREKEERPTLVLH